MNNTTNNQTEIFAKVIFGGDTTKETVDVYRQKATGSDDFICISHENTPVGQHLIDFLLDSCEALPALTSKMTRLYGLISAQNFDHHLVPIYLDNIYQIFTEIKQLHPWWASCLTINRLWNDFNNYSFYSIHPSPYLLDTYDEVDRLMNEEYYWNAVCESVQYNIKWFDFYSHRLPKYLDALECCVSTSVPEKLNSLSNFQRAFLFKSFFEDQFLDRIPINVLYNLHEINTSPLGKTLNRKLIIRPDEDAMQSGYGRSNMNFHDVADAASGSLRLEDLAGMISGREVEFTTEVVLQHLVDIESVCTVSFSKLLTSELRIRRCKNCGKYFVPRNRSDEMYCSRVQDNDKMCREQDYELRIINDALLRVYRTAYKTHNARKRRNINNHINAEKEFDDWVIFAKKLLERAKAGEISLEEFSEIIKK